mgnify:CR=1 FL=1
MRAHSYRSTTFLAMIFTIGLAGCASGGGSGTPRPAGATANRIVSAEFLELGQVTVYQAVERLRPRWLNPRQGAPQLYVEGTRRAGGIQDLRSMRVEDVLQMEYLSPTDATTQFGTGHNGGAILVTVMR